MRIVIIGSDRLIGLALAGSRQTKYRAKPGASDDGALVADDKIYTLDRPNFDPTRLRVAMEAIEPLRPDVVVHAAVFPDIEEAERRPNTARSLHARSAEVLRATCEQLNCAMVHISTAYVFDGRRSERGYRETDPVNPTTVYSRTLHEAEEIVRSWEKHVIVRPGEVFGPAAMGGERSFVDAVRRMSRRTNRLQVVAGGQHSPSYSLDLARAILFLVRSGAWGTFHLANQGRGTRLDVARELVQAAGWTMEIVPLSEAEYGAMPDRPAFSVLDTSKYASIPGALPLRPWQDALRDYLAQVDD